jgi:hypothetical protein
LHALLQVAPAPLILVERDDRAEVGVGEPLDLPTQVRLAAAQCLAAGEQLLRQPGPAVGARDGCGQRLRLGQQRAEIPPHQRIELVGRHVARGAVCRAV